MSYYNDVIFLGDGHQKDATIVMKKLSYMVNGVDGNGNPCKSIADQIAEIIEKNPTWELKGSIPHETKVINMQYTTVIFKVHNKPMYDEFY